MHKKLFHILVYPRSKDEDAKRKEFILNILLLSSVALFSVAILASFIVSFIRPKSYEHNSVSLVALSVIFLFFAFLLLLSRRGFSSRSAHVLVTVFFLFAFLMEYHWGVDVNAALLIYALVIVMAGILVSTRFAFSMTGLIALSLVILGYLQSTGMILADRYWRTEPWQNSDTVMTVFIFSVIALVSFLSNREIEHSLARARRSEDALRKERDMLEVIVEERTRELKEAQLEKISQLYNLAEFGRLSSGLFHDLMNPLTAVSLNVEKAKSEGQHTTGGLSKAQQYLDEAFVAAKRMERFIVAVRKHIGKKGEKKKFSLRDETEQVMDMLSYKAHLSHVSLVLSKNNTSDMIGDPIEWSQIMLNLISNGIDAYDEMPARAGERTDQAVIVTYTEDETSIACTVLDRGVGIPKENIEKIFDPFFTTKAGQTGKGTGIGLSLVKRTIEKSFNGQITVESAPGIGTTFKILLPK